MIKNSFLTVIIFTLLQSASTFAGTITCRGTNIHDLHNGVLNMTNRSVALDIGLGLSYIECSSYLIGLSTGIGGLFSHDDIVLQGPTETNTTWVLYTPNGQIKYDHPDGAHRFTTTPFDGSVLTDASGTVRIENNYISDRLIFRSYNPQYNTYITYKSISYTGSSTSNPFTLTTEYVRASNGALNKIIYPDGSYINYARSSTALTITSYPSSGATVPIKVLKIVKNNLNLPSEIQIPGVAANSWVTINKMIYLGNTGFLYEVLNPNTNISQYFVRDETPGAYYGEVKRIDSINPDVASHSFNIYALDLSSGRKTSTWDSFSSFDKASTIIQDANRLVTEVRMGNNLLQSMNYNSNGSLQSVQDATSGTGISYQYNAKGVLEVASRSDGAELYRVNQFDSKNELPKDYSTYGSPTHTTISYNTWGSPISVSANGKTATSTVSGTGGQLLNVCASDDQGNSGCSTVDSVGRLVSSRSLSADSSTNTSSSYEYNSNNQLISTSSKLGSQEMSRKNITYDANYCATNMSSVDAVSGEIQNATQVCYANNGAIMSVADNEGNSVRFTYDPDGTATKMATVSGSESHTIEMLRH